MGGRGLTITASRQAAGKWPRLIPELQRKDADVGLKLVSKNRVRYAQPVNDQMFSAHQNFTLDFTNGSNMTAYISDFPGTAVGCAMQVKYYFSY